MACRAHSGAERKRVAGSPHSFNPMAVSLRTPTQSRRSSRPGGPRQPTSVAAFASRGILRHGLIVRAGNLRASRRARASSPRSRPARRASTCCTIRCCLTSAKACCISLSPNARSSPTRWASAKRCRPLRLASSWPAATMCSASWWSVRPRSRRNGRSRSRASSAREARPVFGLRPVRARRLSRARLLHHRQLRAGVERRSRSQRDTSARRDRARRGTAHQELANQDGTAGQIAAVPLRLRADRYAGREPHRRALLDRPIPRSRAGRARCSASTESSTRSTSEAVRSTIKILPSCALGCSR